MNRNDSITCDVKTCAHNAEGRHCRLDCIKVTCGCGKNATCCDSYREE